LIASPARYRRLSVVRIHGIFKSQCALHLWVSIRLLVLFMFGSAKRYRSTGRYRQIVLLLGSCSSDLALSSRIHPVNVMLLLSRHIGQTYCYVSPMCEKVQRYRQVLANRIITRIVLLLSRHIGDTVMFHQCAKRYRSTGRYRQFALLFRLLIVIRFCRRQGTRSAFSLYFVDKQKEDFKRS
jgi:hypothetical protein